MRFTPSLAPTKVFAGKYRAGFLRASHCRQVMHQYGRLQTPRLGRECQCQTSLPYDLLLLGKAVAEGLMQIQAGSPRPSTSSSSAMQACFELSTRNENCC